MVGGDVGQIPIKDTMGTELMKIQANFDVEMTRLQPHRSDSPPAREAASEFCDLQEISDEDLTFSMQLYRDYRDATRSLSRLRQIYPRARVLLISDGDSDPRLRRLERRFNTRLVCGTSMYATEFGGRMLQRNFKLFLEAPTAYWIKIDPDTHCHRRLKGVPTVDGLFGTLRDDACHDDAPNYPVVQGGFVGMSQRLVRQIVLSGELERQELTDFAGTYAVNPFVVARAREKHLVSTDFLLRYVGKRLCLPVIGFPEVHCVTESDRIRPNPQAAFTHPHKSVWLTLRRAAQNRKGLAGRSIRRLQRLTVRSKSTEIHPLDDPLRNPKASAGLRVIRPPQVRIPSVQTARSA